MIRSMDMPIIDKVFEMEGGYVLDSIGPCRLRSPLD